MRTSTRRNRSVRLACEPLEDRSTPAVAFALTGAGAGVGSLLAFDTDNPTVTSTVSITGVAAADTLVGIDFRPQNGLLYGLGVNAGADTATLYAISTRTGVATAVGGVGAITAAGDLQAPSATVGYGIDFNPTVDRLRVVSGSLNFRVDPNTGLLVMADTALTGPATTADATAYTNNAPNAAVTTQYTLDAATNGLYIQGPVGAMPAGPNGGVLGNALAITLGGAALDFSAVSGFDIQTGVNTSVSGAPVGSGSGFAVLAANGETALYSLNLVNGVATRLGPVGLGTTAVQGFAVQSDAVGTPAIALNDAGTQLLRFSTATPGTVTPSATITGVDAGDALVGIDFRPNTGQLFGLGVNAATGNGTLYRIDPQTAAATIIGAVGAVDLTVALPAASVGYGFDFNPTAANGDSLIRVVTGTGLNFRINPNTGAAVDGDAATAGTNPDTNIGGASGITATAYTNSFGQGSGGPTTQYTLDAASNSLFIQGFNGAGTPVGPNGGVQGNQLAVRLNGAALDFTAVNGFDIPAGVRAATANAAVSGFGFAALTVGGTTSLYQIDLATGAATSLGAVGNGATALGGFAVADATGGVVSFAPSAAVVGNEGTSVSVGLTRTGGTGPQTVTVIVTGGTATPGVDFTAGPYTVTFADGANSATLSIPFVNDGTVEGPETVTLAISAISNGLPGPSLTTTVTVTDAAQRFNQVYGTVSGTPVVAVVGSGSSAPTLRQPYSGTSILGGVRVATGDVNNDGIDDLVTINAVGAPLVKVFSGATGGEIASFQAYPTTFNIPSSLAVGDVNNDGFDDIVLSTTSTISAVLVFSGQNFGLMKFFNPFGGLPVGFNVAVGDSNSDGFGDIILGTVRGPSAVVTFSGRDFAQLGDIFLPFGNLSLGATVAAGDLDNDGRLDLVVGTNTLLPGFVVYNGRNPRVPAMVSTPFGTRTGGVNLAISDVNGDGFPDIIAGTTEGVSATRALDGRSLTQINGIAPFGNFQGGVFVG